MAKFNIESKLEDLRNAEMNAARLQTAATITSNAGGNSAPITAQQLNNYEIANNIGFEIIAEFKRLKAKIKKLES